MILVIMQLAIEFLKLSFLKVHVSILFRRLYLERFLAQSMLFSSPSYTSNKTPLGAGCVGLGHNEVAVN